LGQLSSTCRERLPIASFRGRAFISRNCIAIINGLATPRCCSADRIRRALNVKRPRKHPYRNPETEFIGLVQFFSGPGVPMPPGTYGRPTPSRPNPRPPEELTAQPLHDPPPA